MSRLTAIQNKIQSRIFDQIASSASLQTVSSTSTTKWGDSTYTYNTSTAVSLVPYNLISSSRSYQSFGELQEGETDIILPHNTSFSVNDRITFDSVPYLIMQVEKFPFANGNLAFAVRLKKQATP